MADFQDINLEKDTEDVAVQCVGDPHDDLHPVPLSVLEAAERLLKVKFEQGLKTHTEPCTESQVEPLTEHSTLHQAPLPKLFRRIIQNDNERWALLAKDGAEGDTMTQADWRRLKELTLDKKRSLRPAAERATRAAPSDPAGW